MRKEETEEKARLEREGQELLTSDVQFKALSQAGIFKGKKGKNDKTMIWTEF